MFSTPSRTDQQKADQVRVLLTDYRTRLRRVVAESDVSFTTNIAKRYLDAVERALKQGDHQPSASLGYWGENGRGATVDSICREHEINRSRQPTAMEQHMRRKVAA